MLPEIYEEVLKLNDKKIIIFKNGSEILKIPHQRRHVDDKLANEKMFHIICHQGNRNLNTTAHRNLSRTPTSDDDKKVEQQELSHFEWQMIFYKTKNVLIIPCNNCAPKYLPKGTENLYPYKICTQIFIIAWFIMCQTWKQPKASFSKWMGNLWYIQTMAYCFALK